MRAGNLTTRLLVPVAIAIAAGALAVGQDTSGAATQDCFSGWNPPNTLTLVSGSPQQGQIDKPFQSNLQVTLANTDGCALTGSWAGVSVVFTAPSSGPSGTFSSTDSDVTVVGTDANGMAMAPMFTANAIAGDYSVQASSSYGTVTLYLTNTATGVAASIAALGGPGQSATIGGRYVRPLQVRVLDATGQPVPRASVDFQFGTGTTGAGATFASGGMQATAMTDANGIATSPLFAANGSPGRFTGTATTDGIATPATYQLRNLAPRLTAVNTTLTATVDGRYRRPLEARVLDTRGRPVQGVPVTFTLPQAATGSGAAFPGGGSQATATTNGHGVASSPALTANSTAGRFTATATIATSAKPIVYAMHNLADAPAAISVGAASGESAPTRGRFPIRFAVTVTDKNGNPVSGALVVFSAPTHGPGGHFTTPGRNRRAARQSRVVHVKTNSVGIAIAPAFTANTQVGGYAVTARVGGKQAAFALVNTQP